MMKVYEALKWASSFLADHNRDTNIGEIYLCHQLSWSRSTMLANLHETLSEEVIEELKEVVSKHALQGVPVQQMIGSEEFYGRTFKVTKDVLIPRPETEELIELVLGYAKDKLQNQEDVSVADIGVGSGAICVTLSCEKPNWKVTGVDLSPEAIDVAKENNENLGGNVTFFQGDLLEPIRANGVRVDILVSNPPYISEDDYVTLDDVVQKYEPKLALVGGQDGLDCYRILLKQMPYVLKPGGAVFFEYGVNQGEMIKEMVMQLYPTAKATIYFDINGKDRMIMITGIAPL